MSQVIPVVLFAYARPEELVRTLAGLRANHVPLVYAFSDGPGNAEAGPNVLKVRKILHQIDWCDLRLIERKVNLGLGASILAGVTEILKEHESVLVVEDDLVCVPGTYDYLCAALDHYREDPRVMSVTAMAHPRTTPHDITDQPFFDGRADCLVWGTWRRAWDGMEQTALAMAKECRKKGVDIYRYGADLLDMAEIERSRNIWAVRFCFLHLLKGGLCLRPPYAMVEHIGYGSGSTHTASKEAYQWAVKDLKRCPLIPEQWPRPYENPACSLLWQKAMGTRPSTLIKSIKALKRWKNKHLGQGSLKRLWLKTG